MKNLSYIALHVFILYASGVEITALTIFMFPHFADDMYPEKAQINFAIGELIFWLISLVADPLIAIFVDRTGKVKGMLLLLAIIKVVALFTYSVTRDTFLTMFSLFLLGLSKNFQPIAHSEINRVTETSDNTKAVNLLTFATLAGSFTSSLSQLIPSRLNFNMILFQLSSSTVATFYASILFLVSIPFIIILYRQEAIVCIVKNQGATSREIIPKGSSKLKINAIIYSSFVTSLTWKIMSFSVVEYGKKYRLSEKLLTLIFLSRYILSAVSSIFLPYVVQKIGPKMLLAMSIKIRFISIILAWCSSVISDVTVSTVLLFASIIILSVVYFLDDAVLIPELWRLNENVTLFSALFALAGKVGFMLCGLVFPLFFNFVEIVYSMTLLLLSLNFVLFFHTKLM